MNLNPSVLLEATALASEALGTGAERAAPQSAGGSVVPPQAIQQVNEAASFAAKVPKMVLGLVLKGMDSDEIAKICGISKEQVEKIATSAWFEREVENEAKTSNDNESLRSMIRMAAFKATLKLPQLINSLVPSIALGACKLAFEYAVLPMKAVDISRASVGATPEEMKREYERLNKEAAVLEKRRG